jgi:hypothetical protein
MFRATRRDVDLRRQDRSRPARSSSPSSVRQPGCKRIFFYPPPPPPGSRSIRNPRREGNGHIAFGHGIPLLPRCPTRAPRRSPRAWRISVARRACRAGQRRALAAQGILPRARAPAACGFACALDVARFARILGAVNLCSEGGYTVGPDKPLPADPTDYLTPGAPGVLGCNQLRCKRCGRAGAPRGRPRGGRGDHVRRGPMPRPTSPRRPCSSTMPRKIGATSAGAPPGSNRRATGWRIHGCPGAAPATRR